MEGSDFLSEQFSAIVLRLLAVSPVLLVLLAGLIVSIFRYKRSRKAGLFSVLALLLLFVLRLGFVGLTFANMWFVRAAGVETAMYVLSGVSVLMSVLEAGALGALVAAVWTERNDGAQEAAPEG